MNMPPRTMMHSPPGSVSNMPSMPPAGAMYPSIAMGSMPPPGGMAGAPYGSAASIPRTLNPSVGPPMTGAPPPASRRRAPHAGRQRDAAGLRSVPSAGSRAPDAELDADVNADGHAANFHAAYGQGWPTIGHARAIHAQRFSSPDGWRGKSSGRGGQHPVRAILQDAVPEAFNCRQDRGQVHGLLAIGGGVRRGHLPHWLAAKGTVAPKLANVKLARVLMRGF
eukprot:CAMPEP_0179170714 /NCGR_PEP_ID=MMETSP0796-20121207/84116_1 /TAXON_ID=73915 /ORGANISM="Pyrodinium bahamense, Strain pbaha01" /LENGTH=222 /DNA_ID=CAMNT_0020873721 /DNA_START=9 /DNA_END=677 /DNA_ORIENTATION=+